MLLWAYPSSQVRTPPNQPRPLRNGEHITKYITIIVPIYKKKQDDLWGSKDLAGSKIDPPNSTHRDYGFPTKSLQR